MTVCHQLNVVASKLCFCCWLASIPCNKGIISSFPDKTGSAAALLFLLLFNGVYTHVGLSNVLLDNFFDILYHLLPLILFVLLQVKLLHKIVD